MIKSLLYLAKEPDDGVIGDLQSFSDHDITVCACNPGYVDYYKLLGYNVITSSQLFAGVDMKFDVIIGNPPYQNDKKNGAGTGSGHSALYLDFIKNSASMLKPNGILSVITPSAIFTGSESRTNMVIGDKSIYSVNTIDFNVNQYFKIGTDVCRWTAKLRGDDQLTIINDGRQVDLINTNFLVKDESLSDIVNTLTSHEGDKLDFSFSGAYVFASVADKLRRDGVQDATKIAKDKSQVQTEDHPYAVDFNGKISYMRVKPSKYESIRIFAPQLTNPKTFKFQTRSECGINGSTYVMEFDSFDDAHIVESILNDPRYLWVINSLRIDGRLNKTFLNQLPSAPIDQVLNADQLSYIESLR